MCAIYAAGTAVAAALVLGVAGTTSGMLWALEEQKGAQAAASQAASQAARSERVSAFLSEIAMLSNIGPQIYSGRDTTFLRGVLDGTSQRFAQGDFKSQPAVEANLRHALARVHLALGDNATADFMLRQALVLTRTAYGDEDVHMVFVGDSFHKLAFDCMNNGDFLRGKAAQQEALAIYESTLGEGDPRG